ncbi:competence type IV pilus ATPase ComGA [Marinococcus halophilus]|uniref:Competence protein ComG n=1 Tax=Marinococcus halophilus TaxID=1371 RepID=A0A510Y7N0_MARHA|nr:competence type IV pilus ATPase ComGA [Marinococcus halophilus]GEK59380.1 competence protein ComG [Marinococcus halophilus]
MTNIESFTRQLVQQAIAAGASDIHLLPSYAEASLYFRIHGRLELSDTYSAAFAHRLITHLKFRAGMDIGERRRPQDGSLTYRSLHPPVHLRLSTMPSERMESFSIRLLPQTFHYTFPQLFLTSHTTRSFENVLASRKGLVLLTGATGSGKSTTLYAMLEHLLSTQPQRIITIEDPVELRLPGCIQTEVNDKADLTYASLLKASMRHDPDVIMIGEIRDGETAHLALRAALTGHLVLTTLHAGSTFGVLRRLLDLGLSKTDLFETITFIAHQRLVSTSSLSAPRRLALFDFSTRPDIHSMLHSDQPLDFSRMNDQLKRGYALGLFGKETFSEAPL